MKTSAHQLARSSSFVPKPNPIGLAACASLALLFATINSHAQTTSFPVGGLTLSPASAPVTVGNISTRITSNAEVLIQDSDGGILWRSNNTGACTNNGCNLRFQSDGNLVIYYAPSGARSLSATPNNFSASLTFSAVPPYMAVANGSTTLWSTGSATPTSLTYLPGGLSLSAGQSVTIGGVALQLTAAGDIEVRLTSTNTLLWNAGSSANCGTPSNCTLAFDANGALKLTDATGQVWTTNTTTTALGGSLTLSKYRPYLSVLSGKSVLWSAGPDTLGVTYGTGLTLWPGNKVSVGAISLELTSTGNVRVANGSSTLWQSNTAISGCATNANCRLVFQGDGNMVLYSGPSTAAWSAGTGNNNQSYLYLSDSAPYLSIKNSTFERIWDSSNGKVSPPARTISTQTRGSGTQAATVHDFLDSIGVNTHMTQYETNENLILTKLQYIGVKTIRDGLPSTSTLQGKYQTLASNGVRFNLAGYNTNAASVVATAKLIDNMAVGALDSLEGVNEINNFSFSYDGFTCRTGWPNNCGGAAAAAQQGVFTAVHTDPQLANTPLYDLTAGRSAMQADAIGLMALTGRADFGNVHVYPGDDQPQGQMASAMSSEYTGLTASQGSVTEGGYTTDAVSQQAQAILGINMWLDGFRLGYRRTFLYELTDGNGEKYGLYDASNNPKLLATVAHNLTTILADTGSGPTSPGALSWSAAGFTGNSLLLQKSNGVYYLILWREPDVANGLTDVMVTPETTQVTVLNSKQVNVYEPFAQASATGSYTYSSVQPSIAATVSVGATPVVLEVTQ